jgi:hypothetical protein
MNLHLRATLAFAYAFATILPGPALAAGRNADISIVDGNSGARLPTYYHQGEYWVAGKPGQRYLVMVCNHAPGRELAVVSVDGVNVLNGDSAGWDQQGYVYAPGECGSVDGWRKSRSQVAAFEFSDVAASYAVRTGRAANVGVIGVALFRERMLRTEPESANVTQAAPAARAAEIAAQDLGTAHGAREYSWVDYTDFVRASVQPEEIVRIRYGSEEQLVAMGVIRRRAPGPRVPDPFPAAPVARYVPDPP